MELDTTNYQFEIERGSGKHTRTVFVFRAGITFRVVTVCYRDENGPRNILYTYLATTHGDMHIKVRDLVGCCRDLMSVDDASCVRLAMAAAQNHKGRNV